MKTIELRRRAEASVGFGAPQEQSARMRYELDIRQAELELQNAEIARALGEAERAHDRYSELFELAPVGYVTLDRRGRIQEANRSADDIVGDDLVGRHLSELMDEEDADRFHAHLRTAFSTGDKMHLEVMLRHTSGIALVPVLLVSVVTPGNHGRCLTAVLDLTEKRLAESARRENERALEEMLRRFRQITEQIEDLFYVIEASSGKTLYLSPAFEQIFGFPASDVLGDRGWFAYLHEDDRARVEVAFQNFVRGDPFDTEYRIVRADGTIRVLHDRAFRIEGEDRMTGVVRDVTEERRLEDELRHSQKMEAVGTLASGIAHDFNNLLMGIAGCAAVAAKKVAPESPARGSLEQIVAAARRGGTLTRQLVDFARRRSSYRELVDLDLTLAKTQPLLETLLGEQVDLVMDRDAPDCRVRADAGEIEQILMNLARNAHDAMPDGGTLSIESKETWVDFHEAARFGISDGSYVQISVSDTGKGMDPETVARIFEPFFTTKRIGEGTGLGLATTFAIVRRLGGHLSVQSEPGHGTRFEILLPAVDRDQSDEADDEPNRSRTGLVLVIEDEALVRMAAQGYLERLGYQVLTANGPDQAERVLEQLDGRVDAVLLDVMMPKRCGDILAADIRKRYPDVRIVFMSAHDREVLLERGRLGPNDAFIQKPFDASELARVLP